MSSSEELQPVLEKMRSTWNDRAAENAQFYVYSGVESGEDFENSGKINYEEIVRPFLPVLLNGRSPKQCRVVEIGCGVGRMTAFWAREFQEVHGVDVSPEMLAKAQDRLRSYSNVFLHAGSGMDLGCLPDQYFDLAFSYIVFQHIPSRDVIRNYLREVARVLKPGGAFHFQLNGYHRSEYRQGEKDTWLGESFSFPEAVEMLRDAGLRPFNAVGAGTQYFILSARRAPEATRPLSSFILPGQAWPPDQLLEGWGRQIPGDCRPIGAVNRVLLGLPPGERLRLFLAIYCGVSETFPTLTLSVNDRVLATLPIAGPGDHYWEFPLLNGLGEAPQALVTLSLAPNAHGVSVRSIGFYATADEPEARVSTASSRASQEISEQVFWIANVERECARLAGAMAEVEEAERAGQFARVVELQADLESKVAWARSLEGDVEKAREALARLRAEFDERAAWASSLREDLERARQALAQLRAEFDERTAWALALQNDVEAARSAWGRSQSELSESQVRLQQLDAELRFANEHPWRFVARKLRRKLKLAPRQDAGQ